MGVKKGTRYRYYASRALITQDQRESATTLRIPAGEIEHLVTSRVRQWLLDPGGIYEIECHARVPTSGGARTPGVTIGETPSARRSY